MKKIVAMLLILTFVFSASSCMSRSYAPEICDESAEKKCDTIPEIVPYTDNEAESEKTAETGRGEPEYNEIDHSDAVKPEAEKSAETGTVTEYAAKEKSVPETKTEKPPETERETSEDYGVAPETKQETNRDGSLRSEIFNKSDSKKESGDVGATEDAEPETKKPETTGPDTAPKISSPSGNDFAADVTRLVNEIRRGYGLSELTLDEKLSGVAQAKSQDMHDIGYFAHESPTYGSPFDMMKSFGITYRSAGENIAKGYKTPEAVVNAWMNSDGHRANILSTKYTKIGIGYVADGNYWTQMFTV